MLLRSAFLFGLYTLVTPLSFFWVPNTFVTIEGDRETVVDFSDITIDGYKETNVYYGLGSIGVKSDLDDNYQVNYTVRDYEADNETGSQTETLPLCEFFDGTYQEYLLPFAMNHNDFPSKDGNSVCPIKSGTYNIWKVENVTQFEAPSNFTPGFHVVRMEFLKDGNTVGGFQINLVVFNLQETNLV